MEKQERTTIKVTKKLRDKLMKIKYDLGCYDLGEVINRILSITPASEIKSKRSSVQGKTLPA